MSVVARRFRVADVSNSGPLLVTSPITRGMPAT
jgi:hypothetical protein